MGRVMGLDSLHQAAPVASKHRADSNPRWSIGPGQRVVAVEVAMPASSEHGEIAADALRELQRLHPTSLARRLHHYEYTMSCSGSCKSLLLFGRSSQKDAFSFVDFP